MKRAILVALGFVLLSAVGCNKDDDNDPPPVEEPPTSVEIISNGKWSIDTIGLDTNSDNQIDTEVPFEECELDNTITFAADSTGLFDFETLKCEDAETNITFNWYFKQNDQMIYIDGDLPGELGGDINLVELTDSTLIMSKPLVIPAGASVIVALEK